MGEGCDPTDQVIQRMVQWGQARQRAIDDARDEANAQDVFLFYYMEMNLGPQAVRGKPGVTNQVLPAVNPDLVSYSSYSATNAYQQTADATSTDRAFHEVLDYVHGKLSPKNISAMGYLGFDKRLLIGEFGAHEGKVPTAFEVNRFVARVTSAALRWGAPFVLYWEFYSTDDTVPIVPRADVLKPRSELPLYRLFSDYYKAARAFVESASPSHAEMRRWAAEYFDVPAKGACSFEGNIGYNDVGYSFPAQSDQQCCDFCAQDPTCKVGVHSGNTCYMKLGFGGKHTGSGTACVKKSNDSPLIV